MEETSKQQAQNEKYLQKELSETKVVYNKVIEDSNYEITILQDTIQAITQENSNLKDKIIAQ